MNKVLIVTYYWPPGSGAGVQRWLKFVKYLPFSGWEPIVLTVNPEYATYPSTDTSLNNEVAPGLQVFRTKATDWFRLYGRDKTKIPSAGFAANDKNGPAGKILRFIRGNFFIPDPRKGWNKFAVREASRLIERYGIKHLITTSPPHSTQLAGLELKRRYPGIKWIADLRDPWTDIYYYDRFYHTLPARKLDAGYEKEVLRSADRIITVGRSLKDLFSAKLPDIEERISVITNGYDNEDFTGENPALPGTFTISYIGTLSDAYRISGFTEAVNRLNGNGYGIKLRFVGSVSSRQREFITSKKGIEGADFLPFVNHKDAVKLMRESSVLLLIVPDHPSNKCIITGKLFEYLASCRPVICLGPADGDAAWILEATGHGKCAGYDDMDTIESTIKEYLAAGNESDMTPPAAFSRENLTRELAELLDNTL